MIDNNVMQKEKEIARTNGQNMDTMQRQTAVTEAVKLAKGYTVRPPTLDDLEAAVALFNACSIALIGAPDATIEDIRSEWLSPGFDLEKSVRLVTAVDGQLVGYIEVWDTQNVPARVWVWGRAHPEHEGKGIGSYLTTWAEARARQAIDRVPADVRVAMQCGTLSTYEPARQLLANQGMRLVRHFWTMMTDLDQEPADPVWADGITVRGMIPGQDERATIQAVRDSFQDHWGYVEQPFEPEFERWMHFINNDHEFDPALWFLAMDGDEIAGVSLCSLKSHEDPDMGWVNTLGVRRPWRRKGVALALLQHSFAELYRRGQKRVGLGVDASSLTGATRLYEKAGMHVARQFDTYEKELRPGRELSTQSVED